MQEILRKRHYRSVFYLIVGLVLVIATLIRFWVLPKYDSSLGSSPLQLMASLLDGLAISVIITVFIGSFVFWLTPEIVKRSPIEVLDPKEIGPLLARAASDTRSWIYRGGCGRYTRAKSLPAIAEAARKEGIGREIRISIMNPNNDFDNNKILFLDHKIKNYLKNLIKSNN